MPQKPPTFKASLSFHNRTMAYYYSQIEQQQRLLQRIRSVLPDALAKQVRHCLIRDTKLLIYTDAAVWATQLRFYNNAMLMALRPISKPTLDLVQIKIIAGLAGRVLGPQRQAKLPSLEKIALIRKQSQTLSDNELGLALQKLSATLEKLSNHR
ncbi:MAG: DciA family protein [Methylococcales bacterium]|nr:DciA family protein [Methylococcales bacterium]